MGRIETEGSKPKPESLERKPARLTWRWVLMAVLLVTVVSTSAIVLRDELDRFAKFGYLGAFLISILASATVIAFVPSSADSIFALGGMLNPFYVGLAPVSAKPSGSSSSTWPAEPGMPSS